MSVKDNGVVCPMPFIQFSTTTTGKYQACCIAKPVDEMTFENTSPMEFFNSSHMKQLRYDMATGNKSDLFKDTCRNCIRQEINNGASRRIDSIYHSIHGPLLTEEILENVRKNPNLDLSPKSIDHIKMKVFGNLCNLKCSMCTPTASSKLAAELKKHGQWGGPTIENSYDKIDKEKLYKDLEVVLPHTREFEIVGGEPMILEQSLEMVEWIVSKGLSKNLEFRIITNATTDNFELYNLMKYFKKAQFLISLDGVGKKDEYIRYGTKWEEKVDVIKNIEMAGIKITWSNTIQLLNIGYLDEMSEFMEQFSTPTLNNPLTWPAGYRAVNIPKEVAEMYMKKYNEKKFRMIHRHYYTLGNDKNRNHQEFLQGMRRLKWFDEKRGTCLLDEWPEFEKWYNQVEAKL